MKYNTKQQDVISRFIAEKQSEFTVKELHSELVRDGYEFGIATIYRLVDGMCENGTLKKTIDGNETKYQYLGNCDEDGHCYLKCVECGRLEHVDCDEVTGLERHIEKKHNFKLDKKSIVINGICGRCA